MILAHTDSRGDCWYFRFNASPEVVARIGRKLITKAVRVNQARTNSERARALLAEAVTLADLQAYNGATAEDYENAPRGEKFVV